MSGNSIGKNFVVTTAGESHGEGLIGIVDGCPPGLSLKAQDLQDDLDRRRPGKNRHTTQRKEADTVSILSGVFEGVTTGTPIALLIYNTDARPRDYDTLKSLYRPGHADFTYQHKYGIRDHRGSGRASARETAMRVACGGVGKKYLYDSYGIKIRGYVKQVGSIRADTLEFSSVENNPFFFPDPSKITELESYMDETRKSGESVGARVNIVASGVPVGLGEPIFDRLDADIAHAMMGINAVKGVEIGAGFELIEKLGSDARDTLNAKGFNSNNAGGILGGISSGQDICVSIALKPTSSLRLPAETIDTTGKQATVVTKGRHDPCVGLRAVPIAEAMLAVVLTDHLLRQRAQNKESSHPFT